MNLTAFWPMDLRNTLSAMWQIIASLCRSAANSINDALTEFASEPLISYTAFSEAYLNVQFQAELEDTWQAAIDRFGRHLTIIQTIAQIDGFMTGVSTNFAGTTAMAYGDIPLYVLLWQTVYLFPGRNESCSCHNDLSCQMPAGVYLFNRTETFSFYNLNWIIANITFPGIMFDCLPFLSTFASSLACFYNQSCINTILTVYSKTINTTVLNEAASTRFPPTMILKEMVEQLFVEKIFNTTSFNAYYEKCAPISCTYTYSRRFYWIYIVTTLLGLFGGLNAGLRLFVPYFIELIMILKQKLLNRTTEPQIKNCKRITTCETNMSFSLFRYSNACQIDKNFAGSQNKTNRVEFVQ
ncbi:unnamed protein product [Rotaria sp. Silwood2]|nr:unnamed protein product [Rotaria sp. Silwood2]CAF4233315.1 unnamed protein product [Rotaria sp. Silwood2]